MLANPPPEAVFEQFGDSALRFRLYVWIGDPSEVTRINHDLHVRINHLLQESGIRIASRQPEPPPVPASGPRPGLAAIDTPHDP